MKTTSIVFTVLLIIPLGGIFLSALSALAVRHPFESAEGRRFLLWSFASAAIVYFIFLIIALVLNIIRRYYENSIMCATLILGYILELVMHFGTSFLLQWSR